MANTITWFEIPAKDLNRATDFYSKLLARKLEQTDALGMPYVFLDPTGNGVGGALVGEGEPSQAGTLVYLNGGDDLSAMLARVEPAGGKVIQPKMSIGEFGFIALFLDSEGNRIGLHSLG